jgi:arabinosaccharide transport system substrate-binding protein
MTIQQSTPVIALPPRTATRRVVARACVGWVSSIGVVAAAACGTGGRQTPSGLQSASPVKLQLWTFPVTHFNYFKELAPIWRAESRIEVEPSHVASDPGGQSWADKYQVAIAGGSAPDLADIEQGNFGRFIRGDVPLVEIGPMLKKEGFWDKLIPTRQALYTWKGKNYGVEHALTPVVLYHRRDLFERVGVRIESVRTWDDYVDVGKRMVNDDLQFHMFGFDAALRQRGGDYFDEKGELAADTPIGQETLGFLVDLSQRHRVINRPLPEGMTFWPAVQSNRYATYVNADWGAGFIKQNAPQTNGMWGAVALPIWGKDTKPRRTSCAGGTGNCILTSSKYQLQAWETLKFYMLNPTNAAKRYEMINLFPPVKEAFKDPRLHVKEEFFGGQNLGQLFQDLAPDVPPQYQHPLRPEINGIINRAVNAALRGEAGPRDALRSAGEEARARIKQEGF